MSISAWRELLYTGLRSPLLPVFAVLLLLPFGRSSVVALLACALVGMWFALRRPHWVVGHRALVPALLIWLMYWLAALISATDAVAPDKSWSTVAGLLRFAPFAVGVICLIRDARALRHLYTAVAVLLVLWLLDAWVQIFSGWSLGGYADADRLSGIFGADNLKLGPVLAVLSPFLLHAAQRYRGRLGEVVMVLLLLGPILLAGSRSAWLMFALVLFAWLWRQVPSLHLRVAWMGALVLAAVVAAGAAWQFSPKFDARIDRSLMALHDTSVGLDTALSGRLSIWKTSARMIAAHPVNGVGVRGFRYVYPAFAAPGDKFVAEGQRGQGAFHAHQWVLEVLSETGMIGLVLWLAGIAVAWRTWQRADAPARGRAWPVTLALGVMLFPLNTHFAFYSAWWGLLFWWLLVLWCVALHVEPES